MKRILLLTCMVAVVAVGAKAQTWQKTVTGINTTINKLEIEIAFFNPSTVRIIKSPGGSTFTKKSLSVIATPEKIDLTVMICQHHYARR